MPLFGVRGAEKQDRLLERESAMPRESKAQKETVGRVMHEFKHGELSSGADGGRRDSARTRATSSANANGLGR